MVAIHRASEEGQMTRARAVAIAASVGLAAALVATGSAHSAAQKAITKSNIMTPNDLSYPVQQYNHPNTFKVSGTTNGTKGDHVDLVCYYGNTSYTYASNVAVKANGTFSDSSVPVVAKYTPCRLRAIPSGTTPSLTHFTGPRILVGLNRLYTVPSGPNAGKEYDYYSFYQQLGGGYDYDSLASCGVCDGYLSESNFNQGTVTFWSNAALFELTTGPTIRSEIQIDGSNAYPPYAAERINSSATGLKAVTYSYSINKKTGDTVVQELDPIVKCADATYPPTEVSCASFESAGVTDVRTMVQDHSGRLVWVTDVFKSTDGHSHSLDLLWDNNQRFYSGTGNAEQVEYKFPGENGYSTHVVGDSVSPTSGPGTIFVRMHGAPDGDTATGQGAIVYDRTVSQAFFRYVSTTNESVTLHQTATVPKNGSTTFRVAYAQGYKAAQVASLAKLATAVYKGCTVPNVIGKTLGTAKRSIRHAGCAVGKISYAVSTKAKKGRVVSQTPKAKSHVAYRTKVALVVSEG
jgi:hypothetical protein